MSTRGKAPEAEQATPGIRSRGLSFEEHVRIADKTVGAPRHLSSALANVCDTAAACAAWLNENTTGATAADVLALNAQVFNELRRLEAEDRRQEDEGGMAESMRADRTPPED